MTSTERISTHGKQPSADFSVGGYSLVQLLAIAGRTPLYAYDRGLITKRVEELRAALPEKVKIHYAVKANPNPGIVAHLRDLVDGFDVASRGELHTVLSCGGEPESVSFAGPGKTDVELTAAIAAGICVSVESQRELGRCSEIAKKMGICARICLRVNPDFELKKSGMKMTGHASQFGIDVENVKEILLDCELASIRIIGLQIFSGSQNLNTDALIDAADNTLDLVANLIALGKKNSFEFVNIGGGYGIPYFAHERPFNLAEVGRALGTKLSSLSNELAQTDVVVELGRYLVGEAGYYITTVIDTKVSKGEKFVVVDGGLHHHLSNSGNFGQALRKNFPVEVLNKTSDAVAEEITIVGPLCTPLDIVAEKIRLPRISVGDQIVVYQSGAYGYSASPLKFLSHEEPVELIL